MDRINWITPVVAVYGAIVSTITAITMIRRENVKLKVHSGLTGDPDGTPLLFVNIINIGRREVIVKAIFAQFMEAKKPILRGQTHKYLPKKLSEGEEVKERLIASNFDLGKLLSIIVEDSKGAKWCAPKEDIKKMRKSGLLPEKWVYKQADGNPAKK